MNDTDQTFYELNVVDNFSWPMVHLVCTLGVCIAPAPWNADSRVTLILARNGESPLLCAKWSQLPMLIILHVVYVLSLIAMETFSMENVSQPCELAG